MYNPYEFIKEFKSKKEDSIKYFYLYKDINLPKNIIFYTKDSLFKTWVSSKIELNNLKNITDLLTSNNFELTNINKLNIYHKNKFYVILQDTNMYLCITNNISDAINTYLKETDFISEESAMYKQLNNSTSDISFATFKKNTIDISFENGKIEILGNLHSNLLKETSTIKNDSLIVNISVSFNKNSKTFKKLISYINHEKFRKLTKINLDTLVDKWTGNLHFTLNNFKTKIDTIITYTYDDDFNKIENIDTKKNITPRFNLNLGMQSNISSYLEKSGALKVIQNDSIFVSLPILKTYISTTVNSFSFLTNNKKLKFSKQHNKFAGNININEYRKQSDSTIFSFFNEYLLIKNANIVIKNNNNIKATIGINTERNSFVFLAKKSLD